MQLFFFPGALRLNILSPYIYRETILLGNQYHSFEYFLVVRQIRQRFFHKGNGLVNYLETIHHFLRRTRSGTFPLDQSLK